MNRLSVAATRRRLGTVLFISALPLALCAVGSHAAQPAPSDTIGKQYPAVPSTTVPAPTPNGLALQEDVSVGDAVIPLARDQGPQAEDGAFPEESFPSTLAETGVVNLDALLAGLALVALGSGFVLGVKPVSEN